MIILRAPSGASEQLAHAVDLFNRDLEGLLAKLDTGQQHEFWSNLHQFALAEMRGEERDAGLIVSERVSQPVREALEIADEKLANHLAKAGKRDRQQFWEMAHDATEHEAEATRQSKARHGGGGESA